MKKNCIYHLVTTIVVIAICPSLVTAQSSITAPVGTQFVYTNYSNTNLTNDKIFMFCDQLGTLSVQGLISNSTYQWGKFDDVPSSPTFQQYVNFGPLDSGNSSQVTGLTSGSYQVIITTNPGAPNQQWTCRRAHVFVNNTAVAFDSIAPGCSPFTIQGGAIHAVGNFRVFEPGNTPLIIDATTTVKVCFSANHTFVSDLGFYLMGPSGGWVELLPPVSAWDNGFAVTSLPEGVLPCNSAQMNTNCNSGNNINNLCFSSALPAGNPASTACVCNMTTPLTGTYASAGPWDAIYGENASQGGWQVFAFDCTPADVGSLQHVSITFTSLNQYGTYTYDSGPINLPITDNACDPASATSYVVPLNGPAGYVITDSVSAVWSVSPGTWNPAWGSTSFTQNPTPVINPVPTTNSTFNLTVNDRLYDQFGTLITGYTPCSKTASRVFSTNPTNSTIVTYPTAICRNSSPVQLIPQNYGGTWSTSNNPSSISGGGFFYPAFASIGPNLITYGFGGACPSTQTVTINVVEAPLVSSPPVETCINNGTQFTVCFNIMGGNPAAYSVINTSTGMNAGTITGPTFCSNPISNPSGYSFSLSDNNNCTPTVISGYKDCGCSSQAGQMPSSAMEVCETDPIMGVAATSSWVLDGNDTYEYILHTNAFGSLGTILARNTTGTFYFNPTFLQYNTTYYISQVVGNNNGSGQVNLADPCKSVASGRPVRWKQFPVANAGLDNQICGKTIQLSANSPTVGTGNWSFIAGASNQVSFGPGSNFPNALITIASYNTNIGGNPINTTYTFRWTVINGPCVVFDDVNVTFKPQPVAFAGNDASIFSLEGMLSAQYSIGGPTASYGSWSAPGYTSVLQPGSPTSAVNVDYPGSYYFVWTESNGDCMDMDDVTLTFSDVQAPDANSNATVCGNTYQLNAISPSGTGYWTGPAGTLFTPSNTSPNAMVSVIIPPGQPELSAWFYWHEGSFMDSVQILFSLTPNAAAGVDFSACGNLAALDADVTGFEWAEGTWSLVTPGVSTTFSDIHSPTSSLAVPNTGSLPGSLPSGTFGDSSYVTLGFKWTMEHNGCTDEDVVYVTLYQKPVANAGPDTSVCAMEYDMMAQKSIGNSNGKWTFVSGPGNPIFTNQFSPQSHVVVNQSGFYKFRWKEDNAVSPSCTSSDTVTVNFMGPDVYAGPDKYVCGQATTMQALPSTGNGVWLQNGAVYNNPGISSPNANVYWPVSNVNDTVTFVWQEYNGPCVSRDSVDVVFMIVPNSQVYWDPVTGENELCGTMDDHILLAQTPGIVGSNIQAYWHGPGSTFYPNPYTANPDSVVVNSYGLHQFNWVVENWVGDSVCRDSSVTIEVNFLEVPHAEAGVFADTSCGQWYHLQATPSVGIGQWGSYSPNQISFFQINGQGDTILNDQVPDAYAQASFINLTNPETYSIFWTENNNGCTDWDEVHLTFVPKPSGLFEILQQPDCIGDTAVLFSLPDYGLTSLNWWFDGNGQLTGMETGGVPGFPQQFISVHWPMAHGGDAHQVVLIAENSWGCQSDSVFIVNQNPLVVEPLPVAFNQEIAFNGVNGSIFLNPSGGTPPYHYLWSNGNTTQHLTGLGLGNYSLSLTDQLGCLFTQSFTMGPQPNDTVFYEDFGSGSPGTLPAGWSTVDIDPYQANNYLWAWTATGANGPTTANHEHVLASTTSSNGWMILDSDLYGMGSYDAVLISPILDFSNYPDLKLSFEELFVKWGLQNQNPYGDNLTYVGFSTDGGTTWDDVQIHVNMYADEETSNPNHYEMSVGSLIGGQPNVRIRFRIQGMWDYWWQIDDVALVVPLANELAIQNPQVSFLWNSPGGYVENTGYFSQVPLNQIIPVSYFAHIANQGSQPQHNAVYQVMAGGGNGQSYLSDTTLAVIYPDSVLQVFSPQPFFVPSGLGTYSAQLSVTQDETDEVPENNQIAAENFLVTEHVFARDKVNSFPTSVYGFTGGTDGDFYGTCFLFANPDTLFSLQVYIDQSTNPGVMLIGQVYIENSYYQSLYAQSYEYVITTGDIGNWINLPLVYFDPGIGNVLPGNTSVIAGVEFYAGGLEINVGTDDVTPQYYPASNRLRLGTTWYYTNYTPQIRLQLKDQCVDFQVDYSSMQIINNTCFGDQTGSINFELSGGQPPYSYYWSNGSIDSQLQNLSAGFYWVNIWDSNGCILFEEFSVNGPYPIEINASINNPSCFGFSDGSVDLFPSGGTGPYSYWWSNGETSSGLTGLTAGYYQVFVMDANSCMSAFWIELMDPSPLELFPNIQNVSCYGLADGWVYLDAFGGNPPYDVQWSNGSNEQFVFNLAAGIYNYVLSDQAGCSIPGQIPVGQPMAPLVVDGTVVHPSGYGMADGEIHLDVSGGTPPYLLFWSNGQQATDLYGLSANHYLVIVVDDHDCQTGAVFELAATPNPITIQSVVQPCTCHGSSTGAIDLTLFGGVPPYQYHWSNGATSQDVYNLPTGIYNLTVNDANGNSSTTVFGITEPPVLGVTVSVLSSAENGLSNGSLSSVVSGGIPPYTYSWSNGCSLPDNTGVVTGYYTLSVNDANDCQVVATAFLPETVDGPGWGVTNTGVNHIILVPGNANLAINGIPLSVGDFLGVFYESGGGLQCAGYLLWQGVNNTITAWGDDSQTTEKDGFDSGESFKWKVWRMADGQEFPATAVYDVQNMPDSGLFTMNGLSGLQSLQANTTQTLNLPAGWSMFSTYLVPVEPNISQVLQAIVPKVLIVKNGAGQIFWPQFNVNSIGNMVVGAGYQIKLTQAQTLVISGLPVIPEYTPLFLPAGWNMIAYLRQSPAPISQLLNPIIAAVVIVKNGAGQTYWPQFNVNNIGNMVPGQGYLLKTNTACTLTYPPNSASFSKAEIVVPQPVHFGRPRNTGTNMTLGITWPTGDYPLSPFPEIGVFDSQGLLVGSGVVDENFTAITLWGDDELTPEKDGLNVGEAFEIRLWDSESKQTQRLIITEWEEGSGFYVPNQISIAAKVEWAPMESSLAIFPNVPNPFDEFTEIRFYVPKNGPVTLDVHDLLGQKLETLVSGEFRTGPQSARWNSKQYPSGQYLVRLSCGDQVVKQVITKAK